MAQVPPSRPVSRGVGGLALRVATVLLSSPLFAGEPEAERKSDNMPEKVEPRDFREILRRDTPATRAVDRGLEFLRQAQLADGSWFSPYWGKNTGIIALATLAFLSAGGEPGRGPYGEVIDRAVKFLLASEREGMLTRSEQESSHGPMYEHGIVTLLLGEVLGMVNEERPGYEKIHRVHRDAVSLILRAQAVPRTSIYDVGGWRYKPTSTDADLSVTGWQLLALRAAEDAGLTVPRRSIDLAILYVKRCQLRSGGFAYMPGGTESTPALAGTGILCLELCGDRRDSSAGASDAGGGSDSRRGGDWILQTGLDWKGPFFFYGVYYSTQAMYQLGGQYWDKWRPRSEKILLEHQSPNGSWPPPPHEVHEAQAGPAYSTALAVLSLTVDYKYLPIYQR